MLSSFASYILCLRKEFLEYTSSQLSQIGLSPGLLYFLLYLGKHPGCTPGQLAKALSMDAGHTARSIGRLEQGGFLLQEQKPEDRRSRSLYLTEQGEEAFLLCRKLFSMWDQKALGGLTLEEKETLMKLLEKTMKELNIMGRTEKEGVNCHV